MKFFRRTDLSPALRLKIGIEAWLNRKQWGVKTSLAEKYRVSRQFIYLLIWNLEVLFEADKPLNSCKKPSTSMIKIRREKLIVALKLGGKCSVGDISHILKLLDIPGNSVGSVSQLLSHMAGTLSESLPKSETPWVILADEIFAGNKPILVIMEARSHTVLRAVIARDRTGTTWQDQFDSLKNDGFSIDYMVSDQGSGLVNGANRSQITQRPDLIHLLRPFDPFPGRFERHAYGSITEEYERARVFGSGRTEKVLQRRLDKYDTAVAITRKAITTYDSFAYLHRELHLAFDAFNPDGSVRTRHQAEGDVEVILKLMENELGKLPATLSDIIKKLRKVLPCYWGYFDCLQTIVSSLSKEIPHDILQELCLAWQAEKKSRSAKIYNHKKRLQQEAAEHRFLATCSEPNLPITSRAEKVFDQLEQNVRSSSPLESTNAVIRDHLNSCRGQITKKNLDMIVYAINHKIARRGPYKGTSPWQRLTGNIEPTDYVEQILKFATSSPSINNLAA